MFSACGGAACGREGKWVHRALGSPPWRPRPVLGAGAPAALPFPGAGSIPFLKSPPSESSSPGQAPGPGEGGVLEPRPSPFSAAVSSLRLLLSLTCLRRWPWLPLSSSRSGGNTCTRSCPETPATAHVTLMHGISSLSDTNAFPRGDGDVFGKRDR